LALELALDPGEGLLLTLGTAWGIAAILRHLAVPVAIKWPNDLVVRGRKLGGILIETRARGPQLTWAVVGVGLNWQNPVPETGIRLRPLLSEPPLPPLGSLADLAAIALRGILWGYHHWQTDGARSLVARYQQYWVHQGQTVDLAGNAGTIVGVSESGQLQVQIATRGGTVLRTVKPSEIQLGYNT
jgi:BirA family biotin operon repressor/biotin-[acetyl-CoA-carboxylase] ligase